ncbi:MAG: hypothetical protein A3F67_09130 [Verrucomicrobia bacterium RIFCSPHIGHO2_12_FULL_41_10]|nr:MAG: hypothetical protein A3F67_09130 [Verrucomicrobia bacterium RIFCSPHIGHO2_12_FULL_41_10]
MSSERLRSNQDLYSENITVEQYCAFLNAVAASDPHHLYNEKMESDSSAACIVRSGDFGSYEYQVLRGRENDPITYVSWYDQARFCNWLQNGNQQGEGAAKSTEFGVYSLRDEDRVEEQDHRILNQEQCCFLEEKKNDQDPWIKSNQSSFYTIVPDASQVKEPVVPFMGCCASESAAESGALSFDAIWESFWALDWPLISYLTIHIGLMVEFLEPEVLVFLGVALVMTFLPVLPIPWTGDRNLIDFAILGGSTLDRAVRERISPLLESIRARIVPGAPPDNNSADIENQLPSEEATSETTPLLPRSQDGSSSSSSSNSTSHYGSVNTL